MPKNSTIKISRSTFLTILLPLGIMVVVAGGGLGLLVAEHIVMPQVSTVDRDDLTVPDVVGMKWEQAREKMYSIGLRLQIGTRRYTSAAAEGTVITQLPRAGEHNKKGGIILVDVSRGLEMAPVPDVRNLNERAARAELRKAGFDIRRIRLDFTDEYEKDLVCSIEPAPGTVFSRDSSVGITLSLGPKPTNSQVPNIVGESIEDAQKQIVSAALSVGTIEYRTVAGVAPDMVVSQSLAPGSTVAIDSRVNLVVSK